MENNQPLQPEAPKQAPTIPADAPQPEVTQVQAEGTKGPNKNIFFVVGIFVILCLLAGGLIYLRNQKQSSTAKVPTPVSTVSAFEELKKDLESTDIGASETDMNEVDTDLQAL